MPPNKPTPQSDPAAMYYIDEETFVFDPRRGQMFTDYYAITIYGFQIEAVHLMVPYLLEKARNLIPEIQQNIPGTFQIEILTLFDEFDEMEHVIAELLQDEMCSEHTRKVLMKQVRKLWRGAADFGRFTITEITTRPNLRPRVVGSVFVVGKEIWEVRKGEDDFEE